jgi:hypothetical protein
MSVPTRLACCILLAVVPAIAAGASDAVVAPERAPIGEVVAFQGGRFVVTRAADGTCVIALQGMVNRDTALKFDRVASRSAELGCVNPWLMLESPGGSLLDGIDLGNEVRSRGWRTITRYDCISACSLIFLGGTERMLMGSRARIGLHQPATMRRDGTRWCGSSLDSNGVRDIRRYLRWVIPERANRLMATIMGTSCDAIEWESGERALELGIATRVQSADIDVFGPATRAR